MFNYCQVDKFILLQMTIWYDLLMANSFYLNNVGLSERIAVLFFNLIQDHGEELMYNRYICYELNLYLQVVKKKQFQLEVTGRTEPASIATGHSLFLPKRGSSTSNPNCYSFIQPNPGSWTKQLVKTRELGVAHAAHALPQTSADASSMMHLASTSFENR